MPIKRHRRTLKSGEQRVYTYVVSRDGSQRRSVSIQDAVDSSDSPILYRHSEKRRIVAALQANSSLLVVGEAGSGKTVLGEAVSEDLSTLGFTVVHVQPLTAKQTLIDIAAQLGVEDQTLEGKAMTTAQLAIAISQHLQQTVAFLICDDAQRYAIQFRVWLEQLHGQGQPLLLLATYPPARDIFLRLPRIELKPLGDRSIREIMQQEAATLGLQLSSAQLAQLQQRCGGNPMLAQRVVREEYLGLEDVSPDHTQWIDGTPFLIAGVMLFTITRFIGLGLNSTTLYIVGGILTVSVGIVRILFYAMPRKSSKLGQ
ncbi:MAG: AAA family ATPase [Acaryochloris sp. SU_5_25]|nr:AAA family ATPase [Acaryochloris sp. SU_5_25]